MQQQEEALVKFRIQDEDSGQIYEIEGPPDASEDELVSTLNSYLDEAPAALSIPNATPVGQLTPRLNAPLQDSSVAKPTPSLEEPAPAFNPPAPQKIANEAVFSDETRSANQYKLEAQKVQSELNALLSNPEISSDQIREYASNSPFPIDNLEKNLAARDKGEKFQNAVVSPAFDALFDPPEDTEKVNPKDRGIAERFSDAIGEASLYGFAGTVARNLHDLLDTGKTQLRETFPGRSEEWYEQMSEFIADNAQKTAREEAARIQEQDPNWRPDETFFQAALHPERWLPWFAGQVLGSAGPESFINPGGSLARRIAGQAIVGAASDVAYQSGDIAQGVSEGFNPESVLLNAVTSGALEAGLTGLGKGSEKIVDTIRNTGIDPDLEARLSKPFGGEYRTRAEDTFVNKARADIASRERINPASVSDEQLRAELGDKATLLDKQKPAPKPARAAAIRQDVEERVDLLTKDWTNAPEFEVVSSAAGIKNPKVRAQAIKEAADKDALGFLGDDGVVRIFPENFKAPEDLQAVVYHEALGHHGLAQKFGDNLESLLDNLYQNSSGKFKERVDAWLAKNKTAYQNAPNRELRATEELLAEMSHEGVLPVKIRDQVLNLLKNTVRGLGVNLRYSDREIGSILAMAHNSVIKGKGLDVTSNGFRYSRNKDLPDEELVKLRREKSKKATQDLSSTKKGQTNTLQPFPDEEPEYWRFRHVTENGKAVTGNYTVENGVIDNFSISSDGGAASIGPRAVRQIARDLQAKHPEASKISGYRLSGARTEEEFVEANLRFIRRQQLEDTDAGRYEAKVSKELLEDILSEYEPVTRSLPEARRAARERGLRTRNIASASSFEQLDRKLFQYDAIARRFDEKIAKLNEKLDSGSFSMADKYQYLEEVLKYNELLARIFDAQGEVGRALNAIKSLSFTKNRLGQLNELLAQTDNTALTPFADDETFNKFARQVQMMMQSGNPNGARLAASQILRPYWWQYVLSGRHAMMLSGLATSSKNIMDNAIMVGRQLEEAVAAVPGFYVRKAINKAGGNVTEGVSPQEAVARLYGIVRAALESDTYINAAKAFIDGHGNRQFSSKLEMQDPNIPVLGKVNDFLYAQDVFFRAFHTNANLHALGVREARKQGFRGVEAFEEGSNLAYNPTEEMREQAKKMADEALLVDTPSYLSAKLEGAKAIRPGLKPSEQLEAFTITLLFPFFRITDRLLFQKIRRSPLAFLDKNTRADIAEGGAKMDIALARAAYGSALIFMFWNAAGNGQLEGTEQYKKQQALEAGGFLENSVVNDKEYVDASALNLSPFAFTGLFGNVEEKDLRNSVAANVASIRKAYEGGEDVSESIGLAMKSVLTVMASDSFVSNLAPYVELFDETEAKADTKLANFIGGQASAFVPALMRQYNQTVADPIKRDTRGDGSLGDRVYGRIASAVPGLSKTLPAKYSTYGNTIPTGRTAFGLRNTQQRATDPVEKELADVERSVKEVVVSGAPSSFQYQGLNIKLTAEEQQEWNRLQGSYLKEYMKEELTDPSWKGYDLKTKVDIIKEARKDAYKAAKDDILYMFGLESE